MIRLSLNKEKLSDKRVEEKVASDTKFWVLSHTLRSLSERYLLLRCQLIHHHYDVMSLPKDRGILHRVKGIARRKPYKLS